MSYIRRMRVAFLTQWMGTRQMAGIARRLIQVMSEGGFDVECVTGPPLDLDDNSIPAGYRWWLKSDEQALGIPVHRYPFYPGHSRSAMKRMVMYGSFAISSTVLSQEVLRRADVVIVYASPATAAAAAMAADRLSGTPYVLMIQDVWPDSIFASGFLANEQVRRLAEPATAKFVDASYKSAAAITTLSPGMKTLLASRGVPAQKIQVVYNWADEERYRTPLRVPLKQPDEPLHIMYAGNLGPPQGLDVVINTLRRFSPKEVRLSLAGGGVSEDSLRQLVAVSQGIDVRFMGRLDPGALRQAQESAHLNLISLRDDPLFKITLPSKTQDLLCAGAPVLAFAPGEVASIVTEAGAGISAKPSNEDALEGALRDALGFPPDHFAEMGRAGRVRYFASMSQQQNAPRLVNTLIQVARG